MWYDVKDVCVQEEEIKDKYAAATKQKGGGGGIRWHANNDKQHDDLYYYYSLFFFYFVVCPFSLAPSASPHNTIFSVSKTRARSLSLIIIIIIIALFVPFLPFLWERRGGGGDQPPARHDPLVMIPLLYFVYDFALRMIYIK